MCKRVWRALAAIVATFLVALAGSVTPANPTTPTTMGETWRKVVVTDGVDIITAYPVKR